jgi:hypothetical protein
MKVPRLLLVAAAVYIALFAGYWRWVERSGDFVVAGQRGDSFGLLNAFFSGLALFGVVYAIVLQSQELELQRQDIRQNREELARAATAQEQSQRALVASMHSQVFKAARDTLQSEDVRQARRQVITRHLAGNLNTNGADREAAEIVCHTYNFVGQMVRYELLPREYIVDSWADSIRKSWSAVSPLVGKYRRERDFPDHWSDFEYLAKLAYERAGQECPTA